MSSLTMADRRNLEKLFGMEAGYVLDFSDRTFGEFVFEATGIEIHSERYAVDGNSKARKLRVFWKLESDYLVGKLILELVDYSISLDSTPTPEKETLRERSRQIAARLLAGSPSLDVLKAHAKALDANYLAEQIRRMEASVETDPGLAIGTAKELIETCCKTILSERGKPIQGTPEISVLTKETLRELKLLPDGIPDQAKGSETIKRLLSNLATIGQGLAEIRNLYGSGHGKDGKTQTVKPRHAKLAVGAAATLATFLFETHLEMKP